MKALHEMMNAKADRVGVERFAAAMHAKMKAKRAEGRGGWHRSYRGTGGPETWGCSTTGLRQALRNHIRKGLTGSNLVDIANFAMMVWNRERSQRKD